jgi:hypothetical protein
MVELARVTTAWFVAAVIARRRRQEVDSDRRVVEMRQPRQKEQCQQEATVPHASPPIWTSGGQLINDPAEVQQRLCLCSIPPL